MSSQIDPIQIMLDKFDKNDLFNMNFESVIEEDLIKWYYKIKDLKFKYMESLIYHLIEHQSLVDLKCANLFKRYDQLLSNILIRIKDDTKLIDYELSSTLNSNHSNETKLPLNIINELDITTKFTRKEFEDGLTKNSITDNKSESESKNDIIMLSDEECDKSIDVDIISYEKNEESDIDFIEIYNKDLDNMVNYNQIHIKSSNELKYSKRDFPFSDKLFSNFFNVFGLKKFRHNQLNCINAVMLNKDCFILMPTGSGKSICYQLPATLKSGVTVVISPLKALIHDQIQKLRMIGVEVETLCSDIRESSEKQIYDNLRSDQPKLKLLYVTPEKISQSKRFVKILESLYERHLLSNFVIDEAHCISDYGHDFRPDYKRLTELRQKYIEVPIVALTATATPRVGCDIIKQLNMRNQVCFVQSFNRPNLRFEVREKNKGTLDDIASLIKENFHKKSGIIYCLSRYESEQVAEYLSKKEIRAVPYHAGLTDSCRYQIQEKWVMNKFEIVCATIAFGMGIDKPDVRFVIHYSSPKSIEGYYQEAGRAGRDGKISYCYLYYTYKDIKRLFKLFEDNRNTEAWKQYISNLNSMAYFATNTLECRRMQILRYFGEKFHAEKCLKQIASCDNCERGLKFEFKDYTSIAKLIIKSIDLIYKNKNKKFPISHYIDIFKGSLNAKIKEENHQLLPMHSKGKNISKNVMERLFRKLILEELIKENAYLIQYDVVVAYLAPSRKGQYLLENKIVFELPVIVEKHNDDELRTDFATKTKMIEKEINLNNLEEYCYQSLLRVSNTFVTQNKLNQCSVIQLASLKEMAAKLPKDKREFLKIIHVTKNWFEKYGTEFMKVINECIELKKNIQSLQKDISINDSLSIELSDEELEPSTSTNFNCYESQSKRLKAI